MRRPNEKRGELLRRVSNAGQTFHTLLELAIREDREREITSVLGSAWQVNFVYIVSTENGQGHSQVS